MANFSHIISPFIGHVRLGLYNSMRLARALPTLGYSPCVGVTSPCAASRDYFSTISQGSTGIKTLLQQNQVANLAQRRFRKKRGKGAKADEDEGAEEDDDEDLANENPLLVDDLFGEANDGSQVATIDVPSLRLDSFCKVAFGFTRAKVEESFYKGDIYVNGERAFKKSQDMYLNDEVDMIKGPSEENPQLVSVKRAIITHLPDKASENGRMKVKIKRWNELNVEPPSKRGTD